MLFNIFLITEKRINFILTRSPEELCVPGQEHSKNSEAGIGSFLFFHQKPVDLSMTMYEGGR